MVNDMDLYMWRIFMLIRKDYWRIKKFDFRSNLRLFLEMRFTWYSLIAQLTMQCAGGPFNLFSGQNQLQADFSTHLKSFQGRIFKTTLKEQ